MTRLVYELLIRIVWGVLRLISQFNPKLRLFVSGRKHVFRHLRESINSEDQTIWMHVASLGEFEQGLPILEALKNHHKSYKIVLTFFSPSGYEVKKNTAIADVVTYLPMDTQHNAKKFLEVVHPALAIFVKYEIWPNYLHALKEKDIPTFLISAIFQKRQIYFKWHGGFMRNALKSFTYFFVQNQNSEQLLKSIGFKNTTISGDTRFDRVGKILQDDSSLDFMEAFTRDGVCFVAGSTWPEDEAILIDFVNSSSNHIKWVIAPHDIKPKHIQKLRESLQTDSVLYSEWQKQSIADANVLIVDTIGLLTKIYSYADVAYVGGGFATGLHNTLEPAVFGIPVLIGPNYQGFQEVEDLIALGGILTINNAEEFKARLNDLLVHSDKRKAIGEINSKYINGKMGSTAKIMDHLKAFL